MMPVPCVIPDFYLATFGKNVFQPLHIITDLLLQSSGSSRNSAELLL